MQAVSSRNWTRYAVSISYVHNYYTTKYIYVCVCVCVCVCVSPKFESGPNVFQQNICKESNLSVFNI